MSYKIIETVIVDSLEDVYLQIEEFKKLPLEWQGSVKSELNYFLKIYNL